MFWGFDLERLQTFVNKKLIDSSTPIFSFADVSKKDRNPRSLHNFSTLSFCTILS